MHEEIQKEIDYAKEVVRKVCESFGTTPEENFNIHETSLASMGRPGLSNFDIPRKSVGDRFVSNVDLNGSIPFNNKLLRFLAAYTWLMICEIEVSNFCNETPERIFLSAWTLHGFVSLLDAPYVNEKFRSNRQKERRRMKNKLYEGLYDQIYDEYCRILPDCTKEKTERGKKTEALNQLMKHGGFVDNLFSNENNKRAADKKNKIKTPSRKTIREMIDRKNDEMIQSIRSLYSLRGYAELSRPKL